MLAIIIYAMSLVTLIHWLIHTLYDAYTIIFRHWYWLGFRWWHFIFTHAWLILLSLMAVLISHCFHITHCYWLHWLLLLILYYYAIIDYFHWLITDEYCTRRGHRPIGLSWACYMIHASHIIVIFTYYYYWYYYILLLLFFMHGHYIGHYYWYYTFTFQDTFADIFIIIFVIIFINGSQLLLISCHYDDDAIDIITIIHIFITHYFINIHYIAHAFSYYYDIFAIIMFHAGYWPYYIQFQYWLPLIFINISWYYHIEDYILYHYLISYYYYYYVFIIAMPLYYCHYLLLAYIIIILLLLLHTPLRYWLIILLPFLYYSLIFLSLLLLLLLPLLYYCILLL